jgi:N4-gp56 family major capsid protein
MSANTTTISHAINNYYDRLLLERAKPYLVHTNFGQVRNIPVGNTATIKFRKYGALTTNTTALVEGTTPAGTSPGVTDITAVALWYGDYITYTDKVVIESPDPVLSELTMVLAEQAGQSLDELARDVLVAGTNVQYADHGGDGNDERGDIATDDVLESSTLDTAIATLRSANAKYVTSFINPDAGYNTSPVAPCFIGLVHPNSVSSLKAITNFTPVEKYANKGDVMMDEVGKYDRIRFIESTQGKVWEDEGAGGAVDVYATLIIAQNAYGVTSIKGHAMETIVKAMGSEGSGDPLNQRGSIGWKANFVTKILQQSWMLRIEHAV